MSTTQVSGLQLFDHQKDPADRLYSVRITCNSHHQYDLRLNKVKITEKIPQKYEEFDQLVDRSLEIRLVRMAKEVLKLIEDRCKATIARIELIFVSDFHNDLTLAGTVETVLRETDVVMVSEQRTKVGNVSLPGANGGLDRNRSQSPIVFPIKSSILSQKRTNLRPISSLIKSKFRSKSRLFIHQSDPDPLSPDISKLSIVPSHTAIESDESPSHASIHRESSQSRLQMIDQEAQVTYREIPIRCRSKTREGLTLSNVSMNVPESSFDEVFLRDSKAIRASYKEFRGITRAGSSSITLTEPTYGEMGRLRNGYYQGRVRVGRASKPIARFE